MNDHTYHEDQQSCLAEGEVDKKYTIKRIITGEDIEMKRFLLSLGCYEGESVTIISKLSNNFVIVVKDTRYSIDIDLAKAIHI